MKKFIFLFFFGVFSTFGSPAFAQELEFEVIRTPETPGFFMVRIFPGERNTPFPLRDIYVANYNDSDASHYKELLPFLREIGGKVVPKDEIEKYTQSKHNRIVILGERKEGFLHFQTENPEQILEEFESFARENLGPVILEDVSVDFGGNVSEVFPEKIHHVGVEPVFFIGKMERPLKTRMEISAISADGEIRATAPLHLEDNEAARGALAKELPNIWEDLWQSTKQKASFSHWGFSLNWNDLFPALLFVLGVLVIFFALRASQKEKKFNRDVDTWIDLPPDQWSQDIPFEVEKREK
ncbi:hypothetical protein K9L63_00785 [Candidatus Gracilibacteria bacterium]|nr:hypothetical protein [Candidatus Gracilibacteria bacterium]